MLGAERDMLVGISLKTYSTNTKKSRPVSRRLDVVEPADAIDRG
jgi:hypothetical protein